MDKEEIGKRLREKRGTISQAEVAQAIGVTPMAISLYESGERIPRDEVKIRLAQYYGCTVDSIFFTS